MSIRIAALGEQNAGGLLQPGQNRGAEAAHAASATAWVIADLNTAAFQVVKSK